MILAGCFGAVVVLMLSLVTIRYRITRRFLKITWLGLPVRLMRLTNIAHIGFTPVFWAEKWPNTFKPGNRRLVIQKRSGLFKHLVITPRNHFVFKAEMDKAMKELQVPGAYGTAADRKSNRASTAPPPRTKELSSLSGRNSTPPP